MSDATYRFDIGALRCLAVNDGMHRYAPPQFPPPAVFLFGSVTPERLAPALNSHGLDPASWTEWTSPYTCLLVAAGEHRVLIDTGTGGFAPGTGHLRAELEATGISAASIGHVIITHGHPDHVGGCIDEGGAPAFPNARYVMSKTEHDFWMSDEATAVLDAQMRDELVGLARKSLRAIAPRLVLPSEEAEVVPGVQIIPAPGHTPGMLAVSLASEGEELCYLSDLVLHPIQLEHPEFCGAVDGSHGELEKTRRSLLRRVVDAGGRALAFHFPFPGLGHVVPHGEAWSWRPG